MEKDILQRIAEECPGYSKRQMAIAKYISENSEIVAYMTAQMLAEAANVSESSVVRFARQFGFEGYAQLRRALQQRIKERIVSREEAAELDSRELGRLVSDGIKNLQGISTPQNERALEAAFHQLHEVADAFGRELGIELRLEGVTVFHFKGDDGIVHVVSLRFFLRYSPRPWCLRVWS